MSKHRPIFYSALLLTAVNLLLRFAGTSFQVYISSRIGPEGVGLLQLVMSVGAMAMVAGMAGIRTASMYLTAEELGRNGSKGLPWVLSGCVVYSLIASGVVALSISYFAPFLATNWIGNSQTADSLRLFGVFLPVNCLCGVMVGYYTGANRIGTLAAVEVAEQLCCMVCTVTLLELWAHTSSEKCCMAVILGNAFGSCLTLVCLVVIQLWQKAPVGQRLPLAKRLCNTAIPLALADDLRTGISTLENLIVPRRLALYPDVVSPLAAFGMVCGMVFPILTFPMAILFGLTELLVPELARCKAAGSYQRISHLVEKSLGVSLLFGTLCAGILFLNAGQLCMGLYKSQEAGLYLQWFSPLAVILYCDAVTDAMMKGLGQQKRSVCFNIITNTLDVALLFILLPIYGIQGYFFSFTITHVLNFILSLGTLLKTARQRIALHIPVLTVASGFAAVLGARLLPAPIERTGAFLAIFLSLLFLLRVIKPGEIRWLKGLMYKK